MSSTLIKWLLAVGYISLIFIFAFIDSRIEFGFHEGNIQLEEAHAVFSSSLQDQICSDLTPKHNRPFDVPLTSSGNMRVFANIGCQKPVLSDDRSVKIPISTATQPIIEGQPGPSLLLEINIRFVPNALGGTGRSIFASVPCPYKITILKSKDFQCIPAKVTLDPGGLAESLTEAPDSMPSIVSQLFLANVYRIDKQEINIYIAISASTIDNLNRFVNGTSGFTSDLPHNYLTMLYFSATTLTTLGPGDIVPVKDSARLSAALEAVLGIVMAGLFINYASK